MGTLARVADAIVAGRSPAMLVRDAAIGVAVTVVLLAALALLLVAVPANAARTPAAACGGTRGAVAAGSRLAGCYYLLLGASRG